MLVKISGRGFTTQIGVCRCCDYEDRQGGAERRALVFVAQRIAVCSANAATVAVVLLRYFFADEEMVTLGDKEKCSMQWRLRKCHERNEKLKTSLKAFPLR
jgi:hypothetical protein